MREPWFWRSRSLTARAATAALTPAALAYQAAYRLRWRLTKSSRASVPVICIGNATLGGAGKTPFAVLIAQLLREENFSPAFLTRGYGGVITGPEIVDAARHSADDVGDEALLLARHNMTVVSRDRPAGAKLAAEKGADVIIMDDGFQNPALAKDFSILLLSAEEKASNGALFPAGPYRESISSASSRADLIVSIGEDSSGGDFSAWLAPVNPPPPERVVAFAGIGRPEKFFATLEMAGFEIADRFAFPDHHRFTDAERRVLEKTAAKAKARLICTEKDHVRLSAEFRDGVLTFPVAMHVNDPAGLKRRILGAINKAMSDAGEKHG